jgi:hypothetical protein
MSELMRKPKMMQRPVPIQGLLLKLALELALELALKLALEPEAQIGEQVGKGFEIEAGPMLKVEVETTQHSCCSPFRT